MWDPNIQPTASFEDACKALGLHRARRLWDYYEVKWQQKEAEAEAIEHCLARTAAKKNYVWNDEMDAEPQWRMAPHTYVKYHRASLSQKGCVGGEYLADEDFMKYFLKRNPQCRVQAKSPHIREGWTPEMDRLNAAKRAGEAERAAKRGLLEVAA